METVKTAVIVLLLMACLYGVYVVLNKPETPPPSEEIAWHDKQAADGLQIDFGSGSPTPALPTTPDMMVPSSAPAGAEVSTSLPNTDSVPAPPPFVASPSPTNDAPAAAAEPLSTPTADAARPTNTTALPAANTRLTSPEPAWPPLLGQDLAATSAPKQPADAPSPMAENTQPAPPSTPVPDNKANPAAAGNETGSPRKEASEESAAVSPTDTPSARRTGFDRVMQSTQSKIDDGQWYEALFTLSLQYNSPDMNADERSRLLDVLDPLSAKVVYSNEHLIEPAYEVRRGDTLADIAQRYNVPWQLLANVNGIENPEVLTPGTQLKVIPGPFRAEVDLNGKELTLFAGRLYAGRFPVTVGTDPLPAAGEYRVNDKQPGRTYYAGDGRTIPAEDPRNPYGRIWIDLGGDVCIHGSSQSTRDSRMGCISLSPADANDLFGILSQGSGVLIRR